MFRLPFLLMLSVVFVCSLGCDPSTDESLPAGTAPNDPAQAPAGNDDASPTDAGGETPGDADLAVDLSQTPEPAALDDAERRSVPGMSYALPDGWSVGPARQMRLLTLLPGSYDGAELAVSRWPGDVGGFAANVGRWAMQAGIDHDVQDMTAYPQIDVGGTRSVYLPLVNKDANQAILAIWVPRGENPEQPDETWTFKLTCSAEQAIKLEPVFKAWAGTVVFE